MLYVTLALILVVTLLDVATASRVQRVTTSPVTLPIARRVNLTSVHNLVRHDQARARRLRSKSSALADPSVQSVINAPVDNQAVTYIASVDIGDPPTTYSLIIDTGSSNTWAGADANKIYKLSKTTVPTLDEVLVVYGSGAFVGLEVLDKVTLAPGLSIVGQSLGAAEFAFGFDGVDGILGIGPTGLTIGTLIPDNSLPINTVVDNLYVNGVIPSKQVAIYFQPVVDNVTKNGEMTFGGVDSSKNTSEITWTQVTATPPAGAYWGINQTVTYGDATTIFPNNAGIVDTGTTLLLLASDAFNVYKGATGAVLDNATGLLSITPEQYANLQSIFITIETTTFEMTADAQLWPRALNTLIGGSASAIYLIVGDLGSTSGSGFDFINGYAFLERFYSIFDTDNNRVGLATTDYTYSVVNYPI